MAGWGTRVGLATVALLGAVSACAEPASDTVAGRTAALIGGTTDGASPLDNSTVRIEIEHRLRAHYTEECVGTLVSPTQVVTTGHCVRFAATRAQVFIGATRDAPAAVRDVRACSLQGFDRASTEPCFALTEDPAVFCPGNQYSFRLAVLTIDRVYPARAAVSASVAPSAERVDPRPVFLDFPAGGADANSWLDVPLRLVAYGQDECLATADPTECGITRNGPVGPRGLDWAIGAPQRNTMVLAVEAIRPDLPRVPMDCLQPPVAYLDHLLLLPTWDSPAGRIPSDVVGMVPLRPDSEAGAAALYDPGAAWCGESLVAIGAGSGQRNRMITLTDTGMSDWLVDTLDPDGDGTWIGPWDTCADATTDIDGDGLRTDLAHDNCPETFNPDQLDSDGDGRGDACDLCVGPDSGIDSDGDGVGDDCDACPGFDDRLDADDDGIPDGCDNCPMLSTREQAQDCNADAVTALNRDRARIGLPPLDVRGDPCDPVACGETQLREVTEDLGFSTRFRNDRIEVDGRRETLLPTPSRARTTFRFCQCRIGGFEDIGGAEVPGAPPVPDGVPDRFVETATVGDDPISRERCEETANGACVLNAIGVIPNPADPTPDSEDEIWRWTTHQRLDSYRDGLPPCPSRGPRPPGCVDHLPIDLAPEYATEYDRYREGDAFESDRYNRWLLFEHDVGRWRRARPSPVDPLGDHRRFRDDVGSGPGILGAVSGVLWTHSPGAASPVRCTSFGCSPDPDYPFFDRATQQQASHYLSGRVLAPFDAPRPQPCFVPVLPFLGSDIICPFCGTSFPLPAIGFPALRGCIPQFEFPSLWLGSVPIMPNEALELPGLELFANDPGPYVAAAEVGSWLPQEGLRYVKVESGASVTRIILERGGAFEEPGACVPGQCDPIPTDFAAAAMSAPGDTPELRSGQAEVLSARRGALWLVGGNAVSDGRALDEVWAYDLDAEEWCRFGAQGRPALGTVLAATYSAAQDTLWVLDQVEGHRTARRRRLLRLDPQVGVGEVISTWPVRSGNDRFALASDAAGTLYVVAWHSRGGSHMVARLDWHPTAGAALLGWASGGGRVIGSTVRASDRGVSFYIEHDGHRVEAAAYSSEQLSTAPGGEHRCF